MGSDRMHTVDLDDEQAADPTIVGGKAATLARLRAAGFPAPHGVVISATAIHDWLQGELPDDVLHGLGRVAAEAYGPGPLAVRSSSLDEDLEAASFAGMYDTVLDVLADPDAITSAVRRVASSHQAVRAYHYRGVESPEPPAVLIQPMVAADTAGVAFTADPVTGDRDVVRISAVTGTGEKLVSGRADSDEWEVRGDEARRLPVSGPTVLDEDLAGRVAALAVEIADHLGSPQDIEWAVAGGQVVVLQARPITVLPTAPAVKLSGGGWQKDTAHYPEPVTPFGASLTTLLLDEPMREMTATFGLLVDRLETCVVGGEVYVRPVPVLGPAEPKGPTPPAWLLGFLAWVLPPLRQRMAAARRALDGGLLEEYPHRWQTEWRAQLEGRIETLLDIELPSMSNRELDEHVDDLLALAIDGARMHFLLFIPYLVAIKELCDLTGRQLGWDTARTMRLLTGRSPASVGGQRELDTLRELLSADDSARAVLADSPINPVEALTGLRADLAEQLSYWIRRHGWRTLNYDAGSPAVAERPSLIRQLLLADEVDRHVEAVDDLEREARGGLDPTDHDRFDQVLRTARQRCGLREENVVLTDNIPSGLLRRWLVEVGHRLIDRGTLARSADAAYLTIDELRRALTAPEGTDLSKTTARRRSEEAWVRAHPGPSHVGAKGGPPDVSRLPEAARRMNAALLWAMHHEYPPDATGTGNGGLSGTPASPGTYRGPVRVIRSAAELDRLSVGDVLVCPVTTPAWTVAFDLIGAVIADGGGALSHAAIVAREHGIPAVLGTTTATRDLRDGKTVTVDGTHGTVTVTQETP